MIPFHSYIVAEKYFRLWVAAPRFTILKAGMTSRKRGEKVLGPVRFVHNGLPDGYVVRLASMEEKHFPTATTVRENSDGSIEIRFDQIHLKGYKKGEYLSYWPVKKERPRQKRKKSP
jgi:hypothetical protein